MATSRDIIGPPVTPIAGYAASAAPGTPPLHPSPPQGAPLGGPGVFVERDHFGLLFVHVVGLLLHHLAAFGEQVAAPVGGFHLVFDDMGQGHFRHVTRKAGNFAMLERRRP